jgi:hypothetical protein
VYFLSNEPAGNGGAPHHYNPSVPLYRKGQKYTASLFFMYLHNVGRTFSDVDRWVAKHKRKKGELIIREALANDAARLAKTFHPGGPTLPREKDLARLNDARPRDKLGYSGGQERRQRECDATW